MQNGTGDNTPSVSDPGYVPGGSSGSGIERPVKGMFFLHTDHLGSVTMVTDGHGNAVSGGSSGGKTNTVYKPYGEIDRMNSSGADITKHKYTGQIEDKESGLYYYKARYYDPMIGRFLSADDEIDKEKNYGMNQYMYAAGNPVRYTDPDGHRICWAKYTGIAAFILAFPALGPFGSPFISAAAGVAPGHNWTGNGNCARPPHYSPESTEIRKRNLLLFHYSNDNSDVANAFRAYLLFREWDFNWNDVPKATTEVDRASKEHDIDGGSSWSSRKAMRPNSRWMGRVWSVSRWNETHRREMKAVPKWYGDARPIVGTVNSLSTYAYDSYVGMTGTILFGTANAVNSFAMGMESYSRWQGERTGIKIDGSFIKWTPPKGPKL